MQQKTRLLFAPLIYSRVYLSSVALQLLYLPDAAGTNITMRMLFVIEILVLMMIVISQLVQLEPIGVTNQTSISAGHGESEDYFV